jgi:hypothetical protein
MLSDIARQTRLRLDKEWTPAAAAPSPHGLLCWAKPAGTVPYTTPPNGVVGVPWDGVWWWSRPDGLMQILPATRAVEHSMQLQQYRITTLASRGLERTE